MACKVGWLSHSPFDPDHGRPPRASQTRNKTQNALQGPTVVFGVFEAEV